MRTCQLPAALFTQMEGISLVLFHSYIINDFCMLESAKQFIFHAAGKEKKVTLISMPLTKEIFTYPVRALHSSVNSVMFSSRIVTLQYLRSK